MLKTVLYDRHVAAGAQMVPFGGWQMPLQYAGGILQEHLETRSGAGLFDVSHMGRLRIRGAGALPFLQHVLSNNAAALPVGFSHYTMLPDAAGGAVDDAYLYRFRADEYLLVVNAANRDKDIAHLRAALARFPAVELEDCSAALAMLSLQGPRSEALLLELTAGGALPPPRRNALASVTIDGAPVSVGRTGYTGEPRCFELFLPAESAGSLWDRLVRCGACPVGLGARDTLRLEAALPLYGHELGAGPGGAPIPIFACGLARFAVSLAPEKGDFIGRRPLERQARALSALSAADPAGAVDLPQRIQPLRLSDKGVARAGNPILAGGVAAGVVTSGTMVPYWKFPSADPETPPGREKGLRAIALALVDARLGPGDEVAVVVRERHLAARIVRRHLQPFGPYARAVELPAPQ